MNKKTYDEWQEAGYQVMAGEKATKVNNIPVFSRKQVVPKAEPDYDEQQELYGYMEEANL